VNRGRPITTICTTCGGWAAYQRNLASGAPKGPWLHLYQADWADNPHNVTPAESVEAILKAREPAA